MIDFKKLRFDDKFHLGMGDVRLTIGMQEEIEEHIQALKEIIDMYEQQFFPEGFNDDKELHMHIGVRNAQDT